MSRCNGNAAQRALAAAGLFFAAHSYAAAVDYVDASGESSGLHPGHFAVDAGGAWVTGNTTARFRSDGSLASALATALPGGDALLAPTADGGVVRATIPLVATPQAVPCELSRVTAQATLRWTQPVSGGSRCRWLGADASDTIWIQTESYATSQLTLLRLGGDGSGLAPVDLPADFQPLSDPVLNAQGGVVLAGSTSAQDASYVVAVGPGGEVAWTYKGNADHARLFAIALDEAGNVHAAGSGSDGALVMLSLDRTGVLRWSRRGAAPGLRFADGFALAPDGAAAVLLRDPASSAPLLRRFDADGMQRWSVALPVQGAGSSLSWIDGHAGVRIAPNGDVLALADDKRFGTVGAQTQLLRYDSDGNAVSVSTLAGAPDANEVGVSGLAVLPDSTVLLSTRSNFENADGSGSLEFAAATGTFAHIDRAGHDLPVPYAARIVNDGLLLDATIAADGTSYVLSQHRLGLYNDLQHGTSGAITGRYALSKVAPDGSRMWKAYFDGVWYQASLALGADRVCIGGALGPYQVSGLFSADAQLPSTRVECHSGASGAPLWSTEIAAPGADHYTGYAVLLRALDDGSAVATYTVETGAGVDAHVARIDPGGAIAQMHTLAGAGYVYGIAPDGSLLFVASGSPAQLLVAGADGAIRYTRPVALGTNVLAARYLEDRSIEFLGSASNGTLTASAFAPDGTPRWTTTLLDAASAHGGFGIAGADDADSAYFAIALPLGARLLRVDHASGAIRWQADAAQPQGAFGIALDPAGGNPLVYALQPHKLALQAFDRSSGGASAAFYRDCGIVDCAEAQLADAALGRDGALRVALGIRASYTVPRAPPQVLAVAAAAQTPDAIAAAQPGIAGAWYAPYAAGQGFVIDYIASGNVVFIPWFTFTQSGGEDPAALVWYTLQGTPHAGAGALDMTIARNEGGVFQSGTVAAHAVGDARLSFADCDHASLSYRFNADINGGAAGVIDIQRLTPSTSPCALPARTLPAENANPPAAGFDARQSGSWFDPQTSGQGLQFVVIPPAGASSGLLYAAWFTYDPAGAADDPLSQHWFTLQGDLSGAANGKVTVAIAATLGGSFDAEPTSNTARVGQATVTFAGCDRATVDYAFDDTAAAHAYRALSGTLQLTKIGGCP